MENTQIYNLFRAVPQEAQKTIKGGRLNGFTDINPMWRIKKLTEIFGPVGFGWYTEGIDKWTETSAKTGEVAVFVKINLYVKVEDQWSKPILGIGGSKVVAKESAGPYCNDEAYKMAYTDALGIACKALGMAADIYFASDVKTKDNITKYDQSDPAPAPAPKEEKRAPKLTQKTIHDKWVECLAKRAVNEAGVDAETAYKEKFKPTPDEWALILDEVYHYRQEHGIK